MTKQDKQAFEHQRPPLADFINQETTNKVKRTITIDPFLDEWLGQDHINASGLINRLVKMYQAEQEYFSKIPKDQEKKSDSETYGQGWNEEKKSAVRERDGKVCQDPNCGISQKDSLEKYNQKLHVHHLIKAKEMFVGVVFGLRLGYVELFAPYNAVGVGFPDRFADYWRFANAAAMLSFVVLTMAGISMWTSEQIN